MVIGWIASALGLFYIIAAIIAFGALYREWFVEKLASGFSTNETAEQIRSGFSAASTLLYAIAGLSLIAKSTLAVWMLGGGLALQALYYGLFSRQMKAAGQLRSEEAQKAWVAAILSTAAFTFSAYAARQGVLT